MEFNINKIKAVIFDMDGVIFDTELVYLRVWSEVFEKYGYKLKKEIYIQVLGTGRENVKRVFLNNYGEDLPIDIMYKEMVSMGKPYPEYTAYDDAIRLTLYSVLEDEGFVKFIIETQDKNMISFSLSELMILRYLFENKNINLSQSKKITQRSMSEVKHALIHLEKLNLIEQSGREYMMTPSMYHQVKSDINYTQDQSVTYLKSRNLILDYLDTHESINNETIRELCRCTRKQAATFTRKMRNEGILEMVGRSTATKYIKK